MNTVEENKKIIAEIRWYNEKVAKQETVISDLLSALRLCLPIMEAHTGASHLTDGFKPRINKNDRILAKVNAAIEKGEK